MTTGKIFTKEERKTIEALAQQRGFKTMREYMRSLVNVDAEQHGDPVPFAEDEENLHDPAEGFRIGWAEAMRAEVLSEDEFWAAVADDE